MPETVNNSLASSPPTCSKVLDYIFWVTTGSTGFFILAGNIFTCVVFLTNEHLRRNVMNIFLVSLAFSDILMALLIIPGYATFCNGSCIYPATRLCWLFESLKLYAYIASVFNLLAISYDRYIAVLRPLQYNTQMTSKRVAFILATVWITPLAFASLSSVSTLDESNATIKAAKDAYDKIVIFLFVFVPVGILAVVNTRITKTIRRHRRRVHTDVSVISRCVTGFPALRRQRRMTSRRKRGTMSCVIVVVAFVVFWLPWSFVRLAVVFGRQHLVSPLTMKLSLQILLFQSLVNPVIYSFYRAEFRQAAKRMIKF